MQYEGLRGEEEKILIFFAFFCLDTTAGWLQEEDKSGKSDWPKVAERDLSTEVWRSLMTDVEIFHWKTVCPRKSLPALHGD